MKTTTYLKNLTAYILTLVMLISVFSMQFNVFAETAENVDLSALSEESDNKTEEMENYSYVWTVEEIDGETVKTLELTLDGASIKTLTLPCKDSGKLYIIINTQSDSYIESIYQSHVFSYSYQWNSITFDGEGALELEYMETQGGENNHIITVSEDANVSIAGEYAELGFGASGNSNSTLNVDGTLSVNGDVSCGQVVIGTSGSLICNRLKLNGNGAFDTDDEKDTFVLRDGGTLEAKGDTDWYDGATNEFYAALFVNVGYESTLTAEEIINIPDGVLPSGYSLYSGDRFATVDDGEEEPEATSFDTGVIYAANTLKIPVEAETYTVVWKNYDGEVLETDEDVEVGTTPTFDGAEPAKSATAEYTYTFAGWTPDVENVTGDAEYTAKFTETKNTYTVVWKNHDGEVLETDEDVEYGTTPKYDSEEPTKPATAEYTYTFAGWTPDVENVTGDAEYTAIFDEIPVAHPAVYTITFDSNGGSDVTEAPVNEGEKLTKPANPKKSGYSFVGWYEDAELENEYDFDDAVTKSFTLYAKWKKKSTTIVTSGTTSYTVKFETYGGTEISSVRVERNEKLAEPEAPVKDDYIFDGWYTEKAFENLYDFDSKVTKSFTLYAKWRKTKVEDVLNTSEHFAYIKGYSDNTVRPENNITRAETTEIFFRLLNEETRKANLVYTNNFDDTDNDAWYNTSVSTMAKLGIIKGKTPTVFAPDDFITRAEFAAICARFDESEFDISNTFTDISGHWAENEIYEAAAHGWIKGYEDGTFRPDEFITRAEAITMINRMLDRTPETVDDLSENMIEWADNSDESAWYYIAVQEATNDHSYVKTDDGNEKWK